QHVSQADPASLGEIAAHHHVKESTLDVAGIAAEHASRFQRLAHLLQDLAEKHALELSRQSGHRSRVAGPRSRTQPLQVPVAHRADRSLQGTQFHPPPSLLLSPLPLYSG